MTIDIELLKLPGAVLLLVVSTATVQFKIAEFINEKRDKFPERREVEWSTTGEKFDWLWGYGLGILVNILFLIVAIYLLIEIICTPFWPIGVFLFVLYLVNLVAWIVGFIIDRKRIKHLEKWRPMVRDGTTLPARNNSD